MKLSFAVASLQSFFYFKPATSQQTVTCPGSNGASTSFSGTNSISVNVVPSDTLCTLTLKTVVSNKETVIPVARSYDNNDWEPVAGPYFVAFSCSGSSCQTTTNLPTLGDGDTFELTTFDLSGRTVTSEDVAARFFEQATFGPTRELLEPWKSIPLSNLDYSFAEWVHDQIYTVPMTSHRQYLRKRTHSKSERVNPLGAPQHPCEKGSRWHTYAFTTTDSNAIADSILYGRRKMSVQGTDTANVYGLYVDNVIRTEVQGAPTLWGGATYYGTQEFCYDFLEESVGGMVGFRSAGCMTLEGGNPKIQFFSNNPDLPPNTIDLAPEDFAKFQQLAGSAPGEEFFLTEALTDAQCNDISLEDYPVYINFNDGQYLAFDPRINPLENTVENPLADGGGSAMDLGAKCSSAARTFLNAHSCKLSTQPNSCHFGLTEVQSDVQVMLDQTKAASL